MKTDWNLSHLYKNINDPQIEKDVEINIKAVEGFIYQWKDNDEYLSTPKVLKLALDDYESLLTEYGILDKPSYYIFLQRALDQENPQLKAKENKIHEISLKLENDIQFFLLNISKIPKELQTSFLNYPSLSEYKHFLEHLFRSSQYLLTDNEEKIFNLKSKTSHSNWVSMIEELLSKQTLTVLNEDKEKVTIPYSETSKYLNSIHKEVRDYTAKEFLKINKKYLEIAEFEINSVLEDKKLSDDYRRISRPDLLRHLSDDIDSEVVDTLVQVITENFDIPQRFYKLKAKLLKQKKLKYYERNVPVLTKEKSYSYIDTINIVKQVFGNLDLEFKEHINNFSINGQYDFFPKKGKEGGAFCISVGKKYPTYILLNHKEKLEDVLTLAHESGHGIHTEYSNIQNSLNSGNSTATAEVASTFFEDFVLSEILKDADEEVRKSLMIKKLDDDISTIFRQVACYNFETQLHKSFKDKGYLSIDNISDIFTKEMNRYCGNAVEDDEHMKYGWLYWSHIRRFFYVYSYASGLLISKSLQALVREDPKFVENVKTFFKSGTSKSPKDIFLAMGIDISKKDFWEKGVSEIRKLLDEVDR